MAVELDIPVWSFRADWKEGVTENLSFLTDVLRASEGAEQRRSLRETPRRTIEADFLLSGPERTFFDLFLNRLGGQEMLVPLYWDIVTLSAPAVVGTTDRIDFDNTRREFTPGYAILMGKTALTYEIVEIVAMDDAGVDLADPVAQTWPRGSKLIPLRRAFLDDIGTPSHVTAGMATATARFLIREANPWWAEVALPKHSAGWRYKTEAYNLTPASDYSDPDYDDSAWAVEMAPFYTNDTPHPNASIRAWGNTDGFDVGGGKNVWMRRTLAVAPGYTLGITVAYDDAARVWVDGVEVTLTRVGGGSGPGVAVGTIVPTRSDPVIAVFLDEQFAPGSGNWTFIDVEVSQYAPTYAAPQSYLGLPVFLDEPNWVENLDTAYDREIIRLDTEIGLPYQVDSLGRALVGQAHRWFLPGREKLAAFRDLLYRHRGRQRSFWLPTFKHDFRLVNSPGSGATQIEVENTGFRYVGGPSSGREYIAIKHSGGTILRKITSVVAGTTSATEKLNLDAPLGLALSPGLVRRISFADVARFDSDEFQITHHAGIDGLAESQATFRTFKNTRTSPDPIYYPIVVEAKNALPCGVAFGEPKYLNVPATQFTNVIPGIITYCLANQYFYVVKPRVSNDSNMLWDAWSAWNNDAGSGASPSPVPGQTWDNRFYVYGSNGGAETLLYDPYAHGLSNLLYPTANAAYEAVNALMPIILTGYTQYRVAPPYDNNPGDNRGGISLLAYIGTAP